jgi:YD repeat-containing protein
VAAYFYDAAGNRIQKVTPTGNTYYSYDERNLLTAVLTYLGAQGTATAGGSLYNLNYMNNNPTQTKVPINASGVAGVVVSSIALANGQEDPSNPFSGNVYGVANAGAMAFDGLTTLGLG